MTTKTVRITLENLIYLRSIDDDINNAILILQHRKKIEQYFVELKETLIKIDNKFKS